MPKSDVVRIFKGTSEKLQARKYEAIRITKISINTVYSERTSTYRWSSTMKGGLLIYNEVSDHNTSYQLDDRHHQTDNK